MDITNRIASNAKRLREQKKLTLDAAANLTGVSRSMLAQIEKGIRGNDMEPLKEDSGRYRNYPVFAFDERKLFETYRIVIDPNGTLSAQPHLKGAEEYITVFCGQVEIHVAEESFLLSKGDSIRFYADGLLRFSLFSFTGDDPAAAFWPAPKAHR